MYLKELLLSLQIISKLLHEVTEDLVALQRTCALVVVNPMIIKLYPSASIE